MSAAPTMVGRLRPYDGHVLVVEHARSEEQVQSGIIIPLSSPDDSPEVKRGVVVAVDERDPPDGDVDVGTVVYFRAHGPAGCALRIQDVYVVDPDLIVAYEVGE